MDSGNQQRKGDLYLLVPCPLLIREQFRFRERSNSGLENKEKEDLSFKEVDLFFLAQLHISLHHSYGGYGSPVVKELDHGRHVMSWSPVPLKTRHVGERCTLNQSRAQTSSRWSSVIVRRGEYQLRCRLRHLTMVQNYEVRRQKSSCSVTVRR
ncbi:uncharacterized protein TNCV_2797791 [Trichonephila clavipes]|nr:uncharacterized protein TNCV_2797791 [Trichonephila clavipes]